MHFPGDNEIYEFLAGCRKYTRAHHHPLLGLAGPRRPHSTYSDLVMSDNSSGKTEAKSEQERDQSSLQQTSTDQSTSTPINSSRITDERSPQSPPLVTRDELLSRARAFLTSPHVQQQDIIAKRAFLSEKSLTENEIDNLLHTLVCSRVVFF